MRAIRLLFLMLLAALPARAGIDVLLNLDGTTGNTPKGSLVLDGSVLYGFTSAGGAGGGGVIFSMNTDGSGYQVLQALSTGSPGDALGNQPHHGYVTIQGSTVLRPLLMGGPNDQGTIFSVGTSGANPAATYGFTGSATQPTPLGDGAQPHSGLLAAGGTLYYGMTAAGGSSGGGVIYSYNSSGGNVTTVYDFQMATGAESHGQLIWNSTGTTLLGMTRYGGSGTGNGNTNGKAPGGVFSFNPATLDYSVLYDFTSTGDSPYFTDHGILTLGTGASGTTVFGMTEFGGTGDKGTIFSLSETGGTPTVLHSFGSALDGKHPFGSLTLAPDGLLYGMTRDGGLYDQGTIFRIGQDGTGYLTLASFENTTTGMNPIDNVTINAAGTMLYGLTQLGGSANGGTIFQLDLTQVPEPGAAVPAGAALAILLLARIRRRSQRVTG